MSPETMPAEHRPSTDPSPVNSLEVPISIDIPDTPSAPGASRADELTAEPDWEQPIRQAVRVAAQSQGFTQGQIGVLITDDATIHQINLRHLEHDYPTDVISFDYEREAGRVEGELVVSLCTATRSASEIGCDWRSELLLYVVHGTLHICGLEDATAEQQQQMRLAEQAALAQLGLGDLAALLQQGEPERHHDQGATSS